MFVGVNVPVTVNESAFVSVLVGVNVSVGGTETVGVGAVVIVNTLVVVNAPVIVGPSIIVSVPVIFNVPVAGPEALVDGKLLLAGLPSIKFMVAKNPRNNNATINVTWATMARFLGALYGR